MENKVNNIDTAIRVSLNGIDERDTLTSKMLDNLNQRQENTMKIINLMRVK